MWLLLSQITGNGTHTKSVINSAEMQKPLRSLRGNVRQDGIKIFKESKGSFFLWLYKKWEFS
ncbi:hypothetical protein C9J40_21635 [Photobacterium sp. GB-72]|nr:hypothetical protein C9J40_21635 [Photobacterium sp. GB-72]